MPDQPSPPLPARLVCARPDKQDRLALVFRRVLRISSSGLCVPTDEPAPLDEDSLPWDAELAPPLASSPRTESDLAAFKTATDLVIQGHAYSYNRENITQAEVRTGGISRSIRVFGDRQLSWEGGRAVFTPPALFEKIPLRYDRAYGGVDTVALARDGDDIGSTLTRAKPDHASEISQCSPFHYPRNPAGRGFLIASDRESLEATLVPNLDFAFDPVTPERLAVGHPRAWLRGPLPACFDWLHPAWFPRLAYLGLVPEHDASVVAEVPEAAQGWAPRDILHLAKGAWLFFDPRFQQGASAGLSIPDFPSDAEISLQSMFPNHPQFRLRLPGNLPKVRIALKPGDERETVTRMNAVIIRPDEEKVVLVLAASCDVTRSYGLSELAAMKWQIS